MLGDTGPVKRWLAISPHPSGNLSENIARQELSGLAYMLCGRLAILALLALWVVLTVPFERSAVYLTAIAAFAILGLPPYLLMRLGIGGTPVIAGFLLIDAALLSYILIVPTPFDVPGWTSQLNLRLPSFLYLGIFLVGMSLSYKPVLVVATGFAVIVTWSAGYVWVAGLPDSLVFSSKDVLGLDLSIDAVLERYLDPNAVAMTRLSTQIVFLALITTILALSVWRSRRLLHRQAAAQTQREALSRYFSPNLVNELMKNDMALARPRNQRVAILFADMVGFTSLSETMEPSELVELLREFHGRLGRTALEHGGTIDKYIGDAIMVHFGTPAPRGDDPVRALRCTAQMIAAIEDWNRLRQDMGRHPIGIGIGLHFGDVIVGNIGDERRLEYTVLGDAVNVASRLEGLTRKLRARLVVSDALVQAVCTAGTNPGSILPALQRGESETIRGRTKPVEIWYQPGEKTER